jgi:hypothetical protein
MSDERQTDIEGLVQAFEQATELACRGLSPEDAAFVRQELVRRYRHHLEWRTPQQEFSDFAQRLKNRQGTRWWEPPLP